MTRYVYSFESLKECEKVGDGKTLLGGKGYGLAVMTSLGLPVPPGFTITTVACNEFRVKGEFPPGMWDEVLENLKAVEKSLGRTFGGASAPLLLSCRSGAKFSMPGMMNTILNIGLNDAIADALVKTMEPRFVYDCYRRLIAMFGTTVHGIEDAVFEDELAAAKTRAGAKQDIDLDADALKALVASFKEAHQRASGKAFPQDPFEQLRLATSGVFQSWSGKRAVTYRAKEKIPEDLGTAVNIVAMIFGNYQGGDSGTGVAFSRSPSTGEPGIMGEFLFAAQGEDVVSGIRNTLKIEDLKAQLPAVYAEFVRCVTTLEKHFRDMQDVEFTVEKGKLWMLQCRVAKRTAAAAVRIAVDMVAENLITKEEAVLRIKPADVDNLLHPQFGSLAGLTAKAKGVNASPGAAVGQCYFDADAAAREGKKPGSSVIMVRPFTKPDDVHGLIASKGVLTSEGGATSHASVVARQFGIVAVVGCPIRIDMEARSFAFADGTVVREGDYISINGTTGEVFVGKLPLVAANVTENVALQRILSWADEIAARPTRSLGPAGSGAGAALEPGLQVWANGDSGLDAARAVEYGARGLGLCRTEHMFFDPARLPVMQRMILAENDDAVRAEALKELLPFQRKDFGELFTAMAGRPAIIRLIDPPLHEFLPGEDKVLEELLAMRLRPGTNPELLAKKEKLYAAVHSMHEENPMLGLRGVRLSIMRPEIVETQVTAIFEGACDALESGKCDKVLPYVMLPLTVTHRELDVIQPHLISVARAVLERRKPREGACLYKFGTMVETPRAALTASSLADRAEFFSFGTNDLTQMTFGFSRDDAEKNFLALYVKNGVLPASPFQTVDREGVGALMQRAIEGGRSKRPGMSIGVCGEVGGDPASIEFFHDIGVSYVSVSPFRVPVARLACAHAALRKK